MPNGNPLVGEVWETSDPTGRNIRGIVADVTDTIITLVSFTGNRFRLSPARLLSSWHFYLSPPNTALHCTRRGCRSAGILRYLRGSSPEWVCPRHLPVGVQASLTTESIGAPGFQPPPPPAETLANLTPEGVSVRCLGCGNTDPVEDSRVQLLEHAALWICGRCNERWCFISANPAYIRTNADVAMLDVLVEARVQLAVENYRIEEITSAPSVFHVFERLTREAGPGPDPTQPRPVSYAGVPIRNGLDFYSQNPIGTLLRVQLAGGPEHRPPPRLERQQAMNVNFGLMYGGEAPVPAPPPPVPVPYPVGNFEIGSQRPYQDGRAEGTVGVNRTDAGGLLDSMAPAPPYISQGTRWVNRSSGEVVEVDHLGTSTDSNEPVVHFKRVSDDMEVNLVLFQRDFSAMFRPYTQETPRIEERVVEVLKDEEWEHVESHAVVKVDSVDTKRNLVVVLDKDKRRSVPMLDFVNAKWRKIVRRTSYDRLLELEDD